jgi:hypothetical protein
MLGSVISGTHRTQDLIPCFLSAIRTIARDKNDELLRIGFTTTIASCYQEAFLNAVPSYVYDEGDDSEWWDSKDASGLLESLFDALSEAAPYGYDFCAHPGDGSDFGFWDEEDLEE